MKVGNFIQVHDIGQVQLRRDTDENILVQPSASHFSENEKKGPVLITNFYRQIPLTKKAWNDGRATGAALGEIYDGDPAKVLKDKKTKDHLGLEPGKKYEMKNNTQVVLKDCFPQEGIDTSIVENLTMINHWIQKCSPHEYSAIIVSGGPSVDFDEVKRVAKENPGSKIVCMKHGYPKTLAAGIQPWACVLLDTRPIEGVSSIGVYRKKLFETVDQQTIFLTATRGNSTITRYLKERDCRIYGWHISTKEINEALTRTGMLEQIPIKHNAESARVELVAANAAVSSIGLLYHLGFRKFHLFGFDGCVDEPENKNELDDAGERKYYSVDIGGDEYWTTGEFIIMALEMENFLTDIADQLRLTFNFHGKDTLMASLWKEVEKFRQNKLLEGKYKTK